MLLRFAHAGDFHLDEDHYFADTAQCLEWFVADAIRASVDLFVINGDLTTYKATIKERNLLVDRLVEMANHAPVIPYSSSTVSCNSDTNWGPQGTPRGRGGSVAPPLTFSLEPAIFGLDSLFSVCNII